ncbi:uncharacterized protein FA14DRAFT_158297 [Meira miltonrushii]|uniref:Uncharacterized protein n=1 Tax=Meira miltonrushii TaxID=1280837 RepID=A0A316V487_9BASI|nr:uncharacterized protein FA14DRAFT_158297 [Meira miltonrushii]PWN32369.1 hypothetical protein FA14DRAFT_158297 [Meira miltonrushii]
MKFPMQINLFAVFALSFLFFAIVIATPFPGGGGDGDGGRGSPPGRASSPDHVFITTFPTHSSPSHSSSSSSPKPSSSSSPKAKGKKPVPERGPNVDSAKQYTSRTAGYYLADAGHSLAMAGTTFIGNPIAGGIGAARRATKAALVKSHVIGKGLTSEQRSDIARKELHQAKEVGLSGIKTGAMHTAGFACQAGCNLISSGAQVQKTISRHGASEAYPNHDDFESFKKKAHTKKGELSIDRKETRSQTFHGMLDMVKGKQPDYGPRSHRKANWGYSKSAKIPELRQDAPRDTMYISSIAVLLLNRISPMYILDEMIMQVIIIAATSIFSVLSVIQAVPLEAFSRSSSFASAGSLSPNTYLRSPSPAFSLHASPAIPSNQETKQYDPTTYAKKLSRVYAKASINHAGLAITTAIGHACAGAYGAMKCIGKAGLTKAGIMNKDLPRPVRETQAKQYIQDAKQIFNQGRKEARKQSHDKAIETGFMIAESWSNRKLGKRPQMARKVYSGKDQNALKEVKSQLHSFRSESKKKQRTSIRQSSGLRREGAPAGV